MRKEQLKLRSEGNGSVAPLASDDSDIENESINKEPTSASGGDPFDNLLTSKSDDSAVNPKKTNGVSKVPSPIPDDSDTEKNDTDHEADENDANGGANLKEKTNDKSTTAEENGDDDDDDADKEKEEEEEYEVEAIVGTRSRCKQTQYHIKWKNFPESQNTWEFEADVDCPELIAEYLAKNPKKEKKVRISLPATREAPKRSAAENKSMLESDQSSDDESVKGKAAAKKKPTFTKSPDAKGRGRPKKGAPKSVPAPKEFEVAKVVDEKIDGGKKYFRIRWKGYGAKDDTWELKKSLNCPEKIKEFEDSKQQDDDAEYEVEKIMGEMIEKGKRLFYVKWKNWPESDNSWEAEDSVDCPELIEKFRESCRPSVAAKAATKRTAAKAPVQTPKKAKKAAQDDDNRDPLADENEESEEEELQWEVKQILDHRTRRGKKEYLIRWKNCDASQDSWEPEDGINCPDLLAAFAKKKK